MGQVIVVKVDGTVIERTQDTPPTLAEMQEMVGGYVEILPWPSANVLYKGERAQYYGDEEGIVKRLPTNAKASRLTYVQEWLGYPLCGDLVILTGSACWK